MCGAPRVGTETRALARGGLTERGASPCRPCRAYSACRLALTLSARLSRNSHSTNRRCSHSCANVLRLAPWTPAHATARMQPPACNVPPVPMYRRSCHLRRAADLECNPSRELDLSVLGGPAFDAILPPAHVRQHYRPSRVNVRVLRTTLASPPFSASAGRTREFAPATAQARPHDVRARRKGRAMRIGDGRAVMRPLCTYICTGDARGEQLAC